MWVTVVWLGFSVGPLAWDQDLSLEHELTFWWVTMLSLDTGGRGLVLFQFGMPGFVDSPQEALPFMWSEWRVGEGRRGGKGGETVVGVQNKKFKNDFQRVLLNTKTMKYNSHNHLIFK